MESLDTEKQTASGKADRGCALLGKLMSLSKEGRSVTGEHFQATELPPHSVFLVFLPLSETRVFTGFPQVQSFVCVAHFNPIEPDSEINGHHGQQDNSNCGS